MHISLETCMLASINVEIYQCIPMIINTIDVFIFTLQLLRKYESYKQ